jgi:hypothetical protein
MAFSFRHPIRSVIEIIFGTPEPEREQIPEPPREPPREPPGIDYPGPGSPDNYEYDDRRHEIWHDVSGESTYGDLSEAAWRIFEDTGIPTGHDYFETNALFDEFLRAFWLDTDDDGMIPRAQFYDDADLVPDLIDWDEWREWRDTP